MKTIIITGASRGIGLATANKFLAEGWRVVGTFSKNEIPVEDENLIAMKLDLSDAQSIADFVLNVEKSVGKIDVLHNNAAILIEAGDPDIDLAKIRRTFEVDLFNTIDLTEKIIPLFNPNGHIVNMNSAYGSLNFPIDDMQASGYRMAKVALNMYTKILAFKLQGKLIVSSLDPGWVKTEMGQSVASDDEGPDREPADVAADLYNLVSSDIETGFFWKYGQKREW